MVISIKPQSLDPHGTHRRLTHSFQLQSIGLENSIATRTTVDMRMERPLILILGPEWLL